MLFLHAIWFLKLHQHHTRGLKTPLVYPITKRTTQPLKMLSLKTLPHLHRPGSLRPPPLKSLPPHLFSPPSQPLLRPRASLSATMAPVSTVEHVVLFKTRESADRSQVDAMISNLRSLTRLGIATHLTAGPIRSARSTDSAGFTHLLHSRYRSESELAAYAAHPEHVAVVRDHVLPACDDVMSLDWLAQLGSEPAHPQPGSALRLTLAKLKPGAPPDDVIKVLGGMEGKIPGMTQLSYGENISPARAKGYSLGFISVFSSAEDLEALEGMGGVLEKEKEKVRPMLESVIVLDFVVPTMAPAAASL